MNRYTDPQLLDVAGAMDVLPELPLDGGPDVQSQRATGTHGAEKTLREILYHFLYQLPAIGVHR